MTFFSNDVACKALMICAIYHLTQSGFAAGEILEDSMNDQKLKSYSSRSITGTDEQDMLPLEVENQPEAKIYSSQKKLIRPWALRPGDAIKIVSPAGPVNKAKLEEGIKLLEQQGYKVIVDPQAYLQTGYLAGTDQERARALQEAFDDPKIKAVFCSRGGYGCARLIPYLDFDKMAKSGKMFIGYSDVTLLHGELNRRGLVTFHAIMPGQLCQYKAPWVKESFYSLLRGIAQTPKGTPAGETVTSGTAEATVVGGCLRRITDSFGTPHEIQMEGKILLIEDTGERSSKIDAMLTQMILSGKIQKCAGIVIGAFLEANNWREVIKERLENLGIPIIQNYPFGHIQCPLSLPLGIRARLDANKGTLTYLENPCKDICMPPAPFNNSNEDVQINPLEEPKLLKDTAPESIGSENISGGTPHKSSDPETSLNQDLTEASSKPDENKTPESQETNQSEDKNKPSAEPKATEHESQSSSDNAKQNTTSEDQSSPSQGEAPKKPIQKQYNPYDAI